MVGAHYGLCGPVQGALYILVRPTSKRIYHEMGGAQGEEGEVAEVMVTSDQRECAYVDHSQCLQPQHPIRWLKSVARTPSVWLAGDADGF